MRKIALAFAAMTISAAPAHAQFENFFSSNGFAGFDGNTANAGCVSGASGTAGMGLGGTTCSSTSGGSYDSQSFAAQTGTFDGDIAGGFSNNAANSHGISSIWVSDGGDKTGGNTIGGANNTASSAGLSYTGGTWGVYDQGSFSSFNGGSTVTTNSFFTSNFGAD